MGSKRFGKTRIVGKGYDMSLRQRKNRNVAFSSAGVDLYEGDCPGQTWMITASMTPAHLVVFFGVACVCPEEGGTFLHHRVPYGLLVALGNSQP